MIIRVSPRFEKQYKRLSKKIKEQAKEKENIFRFYQFDPSLKTHKLSGKDSGCWAFWINYSYRIKFIFINQSEVLFLEVGLHNIYN
ncbi:MAG: type II toxin-antitoxin system mRNA interferase toxin, RelE/StbE family [Candidatus Gribaldobacteria bacterium]|nr:type II toxin-antitoxin system mRNA interferase toxin, RelE/StbE family [Candidatus Gribaldobacteria bacterium]